jgi:type I restriction enzyme M protein
MLDKETRKRIDAARDILVGKVPDPKSQVEQITIALIYKFMDDMDAEAEELGGARKFFNGDFAKYGWKRLMSPAMGGHEVLNLYGEAITKMTENVGIPLLFRDIFKNAYLPYRDPETLRSFLKIIDDFEYDHSERLGDAFEYLLLVLGSQGDAGQFRTPRHIIDFMVKVIDPKKYESILDPACGTAGFLISAYKHIIKANSIDGRTGAALTPDERTTLTSNIKGYDISPDMVRLSLVNLYLHGFTDPHISEYDTLTSEDNWNEYADIVLANPPFMSPKGGIKPHKRFSIQAKRSEVLFVDYIAEHLTPNGRAAVIVPEGIIFQNQNAYRQLRKMLVTNYLYAVVSLPAGVFQPYSGVKTSVLLMDKAIGKKCNSLLFVKVENDGFDLGAQRRKIIKNDLPESITALIDFHRSCLSGEEFIVDSYSNALKVEKEIIGETGEWNLSVERYRKIEQIQTNWDLVELNNFVDYEQPTKYLVDSVDYDDSYETPVLTAGKSFLLGYTDEQDGIFEIDNLPVIIFDDFTTATKFVDFSFKVKSSAMKILHVNSNKADPKFVYHSIQNINFPVNQHKRYWISQYSKIKIPLPPLRFQKEIVAEIEGYQKIINGARSIVDNYKSHIQIDPVWKMEKLGEVCDVRDGTHDSPKYQANGYPLITSKNLKDGDIDFKKVNFINEEDYRNIGKRSSVENGDVLFAMIGTIGNPVVVNTDKKFSIKNVALFKFYDNDKLLSLYLKTLLDSKYTYERLIVKSRGGTQKFVSLTDLRNFIIPVPSIETQKEIVTQIEKEQSLINANRELIILFEQKIKDKIANVWGERAKV